MVKVKVESEETTPELAFIYKHYGDVKVLEEKTVYNFYEENVVEYKILGDSNED